MNLRAGNETDIREEIAVPLLAALGYKRGTESDIAREISLSYAREFLGRKKASDPPLRGRADYMLSVLGAGRWVLEIKASDQEIDSDAIDQAISYARHPEVSADYAVLLNGVRLTVHHSSQRSTDKPLLDIAVTDAADLARKLSGLLSPASIRRDCTPPIVDTKLPLAGGLRSCAAIRGGQIRHKNFRWSSNLPVPPAQSAQLDETGRRFEGMLIPVTGGEVRRDEQSRIRGKLTWALPHDELLRFALDKKLMDVEYVALAEHISDDAENPTVFDVVGGVQVAAGESVFDILRWKTETAGITMDMSYWGRATGFIENNIFRGTFNAEYQAFPVVFPAFRMTMSIEGDFNIEFDAR